MKTGKKMYSLRVDLKRISLQVYPENEINTSTVHKRLLSHILYIHAPFLVEHFTISEGFNYILDYISYYRPLLCKTGKYLRACSVVLYFTILL